MNLLLFLSIAILATLNSAHLCLGRSIPEQDNSLTSSSNSNSNSKYRREWIKISKAPPVTVKQSRGQTVELNCEVIGSPTPIVQWVHGSGQMIDWDDFVTNIVSEVSPNAFTRVHSRLVLDHSSHASERSYTCIGRAGGQTTYATTTVIQDENPSSASSSSSMTTKNLSDLLLNNHNNFYNGLKKARITLFYESMFDVIGSTVILPCKTYGRPLPEVYWLDEEGNVINDNVREPRYKTLPTGELIITNLNWSDMGAYTCVAKNAISKDVASTFLYPLKPN
uniref:Putative neural/ectodermal development factor imp-l2 n=1 Tax=Corethrella appendiculata TaxID=1370023 RepID=U5EZP6_9DIPT